MKGPCQVCGKPSRPCKIKGKEKSFFCINVIELFADHVTIPCYVRKQFNKLTSNRATLETCAGHLYTVKVSALDTTTVLYGPKWLQFVVDHGLEVGDTLMVTFPKDNEHTFYTQCTDMNAQSKTCLNNSICHHAFNYDIDYKLGDVVYTNGVSLCDEEMANLRCHISCCGFGAGAFFVHRVSETNLKDCLKFPESITNILRVPKRGDMLIQIREPGVPEVARSIQFRIDKDGRLATAGSTLWNEFVKEAKLKKNQQISLNIFKEMSRLVVCVRKL